MVLTTHFVDAEWRLQKRVLNFVDVPPPHTGIAIADALWKCLTEWGKTFYIYKVVCLIQFPSIIVN